MADDWARTIARHWLYETADRIRIQVLLNSIDREVAGLAEKIDREETYHRMHAEMWAERLRDEPVFRKAVEELWPYALGVLPEEQRSLLCQAVERDEVEAIERGRTHRGPSAALGGDDDGAPLGAGSVMVTAERVWEALAEIPDPEIPVLSLVDLGVVRDVEVDGERVHVGFTPTFLGCPALEVMRDQMAERIRELGAEPDVEVLERRLVERPDHGGRTPQAPRLRLRASVGQGARHAGPDPDGHASVPVLRLDRHAARQPLRPDPVPFDPLLQRLPPALRAVQDALVPAHHDLREKSAGEDDRDAQGRTDPLVGACQQRHADGQSEGAVDQHRRQHSIV